MMPESMATASGQWTCVLRAARLVEQSFPPRDADSVYALTAALNLLNAEVKKPKGQQKVSYGYIKGMVCCTFFWLLRNPVSGVDIYWDNDIRVAYIRVGGRQFSFHYVPLLAEHRKLMRGLRRQLWDGRRLQPEALQLMPRGWDDAPLTDTPKGRLARKIRHFGMCSLRHILTDVVGMAVQRPAGADVRRERVSEHKDRLNNWQRLMHNPKLRRRVQALKYALHFHIWTTDYCDLHHRPDTSRMKLVRYTGNNYEQVRQVVMGEDLPMNQRPEQTLRKGRLYYRPRGLFTWRALAPASHLVMLAYYCNLKIDNHVYNLCLTYAIVRYLAQRFPDLRFINILNYNRHKVHGRIYTPTALDRVPPNSKARKLKVWMVVDTMQTLCNYQACQLPVNLLTDYLRTPDYLDTYRVVSHRDKVGLYAYSRFHLLPAVYRHITVHGNYAQVTRDDGKMAVYSLHLERFVTPFAYDDIWYDRQRYAILGRHDGTVDVIHDFVVW